MGWQVYSIALLNLIPGVELTVLDQNCCGIAGTFGFKKENYPYSQKIGEELFGLIRKADPQVVATDCETCKWQIEMSTGYPVMNPVSILAGALK
jgi:glycerol-3-phosphate dehydrogenase subunit C